MIFQNQNQYSGGQNNTVNQNTSFYKGYSDDSAIELSGWNNKISIQMRPFVGKNSSGLNTYERDRSKIINTALTFENCEALTEALKKIVDPAIDNGDSANVSIVINDSNNTAGSKKILTVRHEGDGKVVLEIACNVGEDNVAIPQYTHTYTFGNRKYLTGYDGTTGDCFRETNIFSEYKIFEGIVSNYLSLVPIEYHANKYAKSNEYHPNTQAQNQQGGGYQARPQVPQQQMYNQYPSQAPVTQGGSFAETELPF